MKNGRRGKSWGAMSAGELAEATRQFDGPIAAEKIKPLSPVAKARLKQARRAPKRRSTQTPVVVHLEDDLLRRSQEYAQQHNMSISEFVNRSVKGSLAVVEE
jgi:hypothetical protein